MSPSKGCRVGTEFLDQSRRGYLRFWHVPPLARVHTTSTRQKSSISKWHRISASRPQYHSLMGTVCQRTLNPTAREEVIFGTALSNTPNQWLTPERLLGTCLCKTWLDLAPNLRPTHSDPEGEIDAALERRL